MRTRVKICGITRPADAEAAIEAGADALGFICYPPSPRHVKIEQLTDLSTLASPFVTVVAVVVDPQSSQLGRLLDSASIDVIQFHGAETPAFCRGFGRPWIKAVRMRDDVEIGVAARPYREARGLLVDAWHEKWVGGTGETFDWRRLTGLEPRRLVLAGGLNPENIGKAIHTVRPCAVDVSTGVENSPGVKNKDAINAFMEAVRQADSESCDHR